MAECEFFRDAIAYGSNLEETILISLLASLDVGACPDLFKTLDIWLHGHQHYMSMFATRWAEVPQDPNEFPVGFLLGNGGMMKVYESCSKPRALYRRLTVHLTVWIQVWDLVKTCKNTTPCKRTQGRAQVQCKGKYYLLLVSLLLAGVLVSLPVLLPVLKEFKISFTQGSARKGGSRGTLQLRPMNAPFLLRDSCLKTHPPKFPARNLQTGFWTCCFPPGLSRLQGGNVFKRV